MSDPAAAAAAAAASPGAAPTAAHTTQDYIRSNGHTALLQSLN
jgi:hypothetical protein